MQEGCCSHYVCSLFNASVTTYKLVDMGFSPVTFLVLAESNKIMFNLGVLDYFFSILNFFTKTSATNLIDFFFGNVHCFGLFHLFQIYLTTVK